MLLHSNLNIPSNEHDRKTKISYFNNQLTSWKDKKDLGGLRWIDNEEFETDLDTPFAY